MIFIRSSLYTDHSISQITWFDHQGRNRYHHHRIEWMIKNILYQISYPSYCCCCGENQQNETKNQKTTKKTLKIKIEFYF